jgi:hypothetical protein
MNTANDNVVFGNLVDRWERGDITELPHNRPPKSEVRKGILDSFCSALIQEGGSIAIYKGIVYAGNSRIKLALERRQLGRMTLGEYDFPVRVLYPSTQEEADKFANGSNISTPVSKTNNAMLNTTVLGRWVKKLAIETGLPRQLLANRIGNILDSAFYAQEQTSLSVNMGSNHKLTPVACSPTTTEEDFPVSDALYQRIKSALQDFAELRREAESRESQGKLVFDAVKKMLLMTSGRPSPGFFLVYLADHLANEFGSFTTSKTPQRILQHMNTNAEGLFKFGTDFTRKQGSRLFAVSAIREMMKSL